MQAADKAGAFINDLRDYVKIQVELKKLEAVQNTARISAGLIAGLIFLAVAFVIFCVLTIAVGLWIGDVMQSNALGFGMLGGIYAVLLLLLAIFKEQLIKRPFRNRVISALLGN